MARKSVRWHAPEQSLGKLRDADVGLVGGAGPQRRGGKPKGPRELGRRHNGGTGQELKQRAGRQAG